MATFDDKGRPLDANGKVIDPNTGGPVIEPCRHIQVTLTAPTGTGKSTLISCVARHLQAIGFQLDPTTQTIMDDREFRRVSRQRNRETMITFVEEDE